MSSERDELAKLISSASLVFLGTIIGSTSKLVERAIVGRLLSPALYGEFSVALAIFTLAGILGAAGFIQGVPRFIARFENPVDIRGVWLTGLLVALSFSLIISATLFLCAPLIVPSLFETEQANHTFVIFAITIPVYISFRIGIGAIRGQENTQFKVITQDLGYPILRMSVIFILLTMGVGLVGTALGYLVALLAITGATYILLNRLISLRGAYRLHTREMTRFSAPLVVSTIMTVLLTRTDTVMLGYFRESGEVGLYNAAYPLAGVLTVVLGAFGYLYLPLASRLDSGDSGSVERVYEVTTKWVFILVFPAFVTLVVFPGEIISIVFGREFEAGGAALWILAIGFFTNAGVGRHRETLSALGATKFILISNVIAFIANFMLNLVLIPQFGFEGAAVASTSSFVLLNIVVCVFLHILFGITPFNQTSLKAILGLPLFLLPLGYFLSKITPDSLPFIVAFGVCMGVLSIISVIALGSLEPEDAVLLDFMEENTGIRIPVIRDYIPDQ